MIFLELDHEVLPSNRGTLVPFVPELNGTLKALKLMSSEEQISLVREEGCSVLEFSTVCCTDFRVVWSEAKNRDS